MEQAYFETVMRENYRKMGEDRGFWENVSMVSDLYHTGAISVDEHHFLRDLNRHLCDVLFPL